MLRLTVIDVAENLVDVKLTRVSKASIPEQDRCVPKVLLSVVRG